LQADYNFSAEAWREQHFQYLFADSIPPIEIINNTRSYYRKESAASGIKGTSKGSKAACTICWKRSVYMILLCWDEICGRIILMYWNKLQCTIQQKNLFSRDRLLLTVIFLNYKIVSSIQHLSFVNPLSTSALPLTSS
jgi:hypothetical protein